MGVRLRGSGAGARWYGLITQLTFAGAITLGLVYTNPTQSLVDRSLAPLAVLFVVGLALLALRTLFVGVFLAPDRLIIRSWLRTYSLPLASSVRCDTTPWSSWVATRSVDSGIWLMLTFSWTDESGRRRTSPRPVTVAGRHHARQQAAVINAFVAAATAQSVDDPARVDGNSDDLARAYARGAAREAIVRDLRARRKPTVSTGLAWLGLARYPDIPKSQEPLDINTARPSGPGQTPSTEDLAHRGREN